MMRVTASRLWKRRYFNFRNCSSICSQAAQSLSPVNRSLLDSNRRLEGSALHEHVSDQTLSMYPGNGVTEYV